MLVKEKATSEKFMLLTFSLISQTHLSLNLSVNNCLFYQPIGLCILAKVIPPLLAFRRGDCTLNTSQLVVKGKS